jgi:hypothetical protein
VKHQGEAEGKRVATMRSGRERARHQIHARHGEGGNILNFELTKDVHHVQHVIFFPHPLLAERSLSQQQQQQQEQRLPQEMFGPLGISIVLIASVSIVAALFSIPMMSLEAQNRRVDLYRKMEEDSEEIMPVL